jgi:uncharacterized delta-60 repeat protein
MTNSFNTGIYTIRAIDTTHVYVGGNFTSYNGTTANGIIRINTDGSVDTTFNSGGSGFNSVVNKIAIQTDGKIICAGTFTTYNGTGANGIIRLTTTGAIDGTFAYGTAFGGTPNIIALAIQTDGKILVGGTFTTYNGTGANRIIRLTTTGAVDGTFVYLTGFGSTVQCITLQTDGKILVGGSFTTYQGTGANRIIRLTTTGAIDGTFVYGNGFVLTPVPANTVIFQIQIQSSGKIIAIGQFTEYNLSLTNSICRLNTNGTIDNTFVSGFATYLDFPKCLTIQSSNDYLYLGGTFTSYGGNSANLIARTDSNGNFDTTWAIGTAFNTGVAYAVNNINFLQTGALICVGQLWSTFNGQGTYNRIISLLT